VDPPFVIVITGIVIEHPLFIGGKMVIAEDVAGEDHHHQYQRIAEIEEQAGDNQEVGQI